MPFQIGKNKLLIGGGLLVLLVIVVIVLIAMKKKTPQEHAADAVDSANIAVMHSKIAAAAASSPDNSAKDSTVKTAVDASKQASVQSADSASKAAAGGVPVTQPNDSQSNAPVSQPVTNTYLMLTSPSSVANNYLVLTNGLPVALTTDITQATPISVSQYHINAEGMQEIVTLVQTVSGKYINIVSNNDVTTAGGHNVSMSDTYFVNSSGTQATLTVNSADAIQTFFQNIQYWYIAYTSPGSLVFNSAGNSSAVTVKVVSQ